MTLTPEELEDFKARYQNAFNVRLSDEEALDLADRLEELYRIVLNRSAEPSEMPRAPSVSWRLRSPMADGET